VRENSLEAGATLQMGRSPLAELEGDVKNIEISKSSTPKNPVLRRTSQCSKKIEVQIKFNYGYYKNEIFLDHLTPY
jgi:hypothetical protein